MGIFHQRFAIESHIPLDQAWKKLLPVVKTDMPVCAECGQVLAGMDVARFCSKCGASLSHPPPLPQPWAMRYFFSADALQGFEFEGDISPQGFRLSRIISYRNACLPVVTGRLEASATGTRIGIEMRMNVVGWVFLVGTMGISFLVLSTLFAAGNKIPEVLVIVAPCFFLAVSWIAFASEVRTARAALARILEAAPTG